MSDANSSLSLSSVPFPPSFAIRRRWKGRGWRIRRKLLKRPEVKKRFLYEREKQGRRRLMRKRKAIVVFPGDSDWPDVEKRVEKKIISEIRYAARVLWTPKFPRIPDIGKIPEPERQEFLEAWVARDRYHVVSIMDTFSDASRELCKDVIECSTNMKSRFETIGSKSSIVGLILEKNVEPEIITKELVPIAKEKKVPVISIYGLRKAIFEVSGIPGCNALGFKEQCTSIISPFNSLLELVKKYSPIRIDPSEEPDYRKDDDDYSSDDSSGWEKWNRWDEVRAIYDRPTE